MLSEIEAYCLAYLSDEQIEAEGGIPSALLAAMREDDKATAEFAHSYLVGMGLLIETFSEMPEYPDFYWENESTGTDESIEESL